MLDGDIEFLKAIFSQPALVHLSYKFYFSACQEGISQNYLGHHIAPSLGECIALQWIPSQMLGFGVMFVVSLNKPFNKHSYCWWASWIQCYCVSIFAYMDAINPMCRNCNARNNHDYFNNGDNSCNEHLILIVITVIVEWGKTYIDCYDNDNIICSDNNDSHFDNDILVIRQWWWRPDDYNGNGDRICVIIDSK